MTTVDALSREDMSLYEEVDDADFPTNFYLHDPDLSAVDGVPSKYWKIGVEPAVVEMTEAEKTDVERPARLREVDRKTERLIRNGFSYASKTFSLSIAAQETWAQMRATADDLTYPYVVNTLEDESTYSIPDVTDMNAFTQAAIDRVLEERGAGRAIKDDLRDAVTLAALAAVEDTR